MKFYKIIYTCNRRRVLSASLSFTAQGRPIAWCKFVYMYNVTHKM